MAAGWITTAVILSYAWVTAVHAANLGSLTKLRTRMRTKKASSDFRETFSAPTMILMSSPMERKVSYAMLDNFKAVGGVVLPILDAGLVAPYGIAWDQERSALYVCDGALRKILRVKLKAFRCHRQCKGIDYQLRTDGNQYTVVDGVIAQWASVDKDGNLYFTDQETNSVSKLPVETIELIITDKLLPKDLKRTSEAVMAGDEAATENVEAEDDANSTKKSLPTPMPPSIFQMYQNGVSENVGTPAGIVAEGSSLYWTNQVGGFSSGSVVEGKTNPRVLTPAAESEAAPVDVAAGEEEQPSFPSLKISNNTGSAYGMCLTSSKVLYTDSSHYVWACNRGTGETVALTHGMLKPRGIVWDGDNTVYVADQEGNYIVSMPVGLLKPNAPVSHTLDIHSPFGIALIGSTDKIWAPFQTQFAGAHRIATLRSSIVLLVSAALTMVLS